MQTGVVPHSTATKFALRPVLPGACIKRIESCHCVSTAFYPLPVGVMVANDIHMQARQYILYESISSDGESGIIPVIGNEAELRSALGVRVLLEPRISETS
jgi:hypothetical protein